MPAEPKLYHIVHIDRLSSIVTDNYLWCDAKIGQCESSGTTISMNSIKQRRLTNALSSHPDLCVGDCVPFYFCPRSVMLYVISQANHPELTYQGGQDPIVHLEADLQQTISWAKKHNQRWAFTHSNAGAVYFEDWCDLGQMDKIDWEAVQAKDWRQHKEGKQAEFLIEQQFPWKLVSRIGVRSPQVSRQTLSAIEAGVHQPPIDIKPEWYY